MKKQVVVLQPAEVHPFCKFEGSQEIGTHSEIALATVIGDPALPDLVDHLRTVLGASRFDECVAAGASMELAEAVQYARAQIQLAQRDLDRPL